MSLTTLQQDTPNQYTVHAREDWMLEDFPRVITLTTPDNRLPLPSPACLALHALCCEASWLSGAGQYLEKIDEEIENTQVLANDGSSAQLLSSALSRLVMHSD